MAATRGLINTCTQLSIGLSTCSTCMRFSSNHFVQIYSCIILRGKLKEAALGRSPMYTMAAPVILVLSYGTTRLLRNSPAQCGKLKQIGANQITSQLYHGFLMGMVVPSLTLGWYTIKKPWYNYTYTVHPFRRVFSNLYPLINSYS